jgi:hypothetical protein
VSNSSSRSLQAAAAGAAAGQDRGHSSSTSWQAAAAAGGGGGTGGVLRGDRSSSRNEQAEQLEDRVGALGDMRFLGALVPDGRQGRRGGGGARWLHHGNLVGIAGEQVGNPPCMSYVSSRGGASCTTITGITVEERHLGLLCLFLL